MDDWGYAVEAWAVALRQDKAAHRRWAEDREREVLEAQARARAEAS